MKVILTYFLFFFSNLIFAQNNQLTFDKQYVYGLINEKELNSDFTNLKINLYVASSESIGLADIYSTYLKTDLSLFKKGKILKLSQFGFENNQISVSKEAHLFNRVKVVDSLLSSKITFESLNKKGSFLGFACDYYTLKSDIFNDNLIITNVNCVCIDTTNKNKNVKIIFPNSNIDGLILGFSFTESLDNMIVLNEIKNIDIKNSFDFDSEYILAENNYNDFLKRISDEENHVFDYDKTILPPTSNFYKNYILDPLCNSYLYFNELDTKLKNLAERFTSIGCKLHYEDFSFENKESEYSRKLVIELAKSQSNDLLKQAFKSKVINKTERKKLAKAFEKFYNEASIFNENQDIIEEVTNESTSDDIWNGTGVESAEYISEYKSLQVDINNLAAESKLNEDIEQYMPNYCSDLKNRVPNFKNDNLKIHVYNLVGQICDLYLYQNGGNVNYFLTIDSMRKSLLEIENMRSQLSKKDTKLLNEFLNSLD